MHSNGMEGEFLAMDMPWDANSPERGTLGKLVLVRMGTWVCALRKNMGPKHVRKRASEEE